VAVVDAEQVLAERSLTVTGSHATSVLSLIDEVLAATAFSLSDLELLAVSIGPGSFTGLRIGLGVAKGFHLSTGIPLVGVPTLEVLALALGPRRGFVCPVLDARKGEVYAAAFRWEAAGLREVHAARALAPQAFARDLELPCTLLGDGVDAYAQVWKRHFGERAELFGSASLPASGAATAHLGERLFLCRGPDDPGGLEPTYLRRAEAEVKRGSAAPNANVRKIDTLGGLG
jgi:tRNA threonylcarbamoyladenosine biosynthesis protein TsaB